MHRPLGNIVQHISTTLRSARVVELSAGGDTRPYRPLGALWAFILSR